MKSFSKYFIGLSLVASFGLSSCVNDLDVPEKDPNKETLDVLLQKDPRGTLDRVIAEVYQGLATASPWGPGSTILGLAGDAGATAFPRTLFFLEEIPTDEFSWLQFADAGLYELVTQAFAPDNEVMYTSYSRLYTEIALCNEAIRTINNNRGIFTKEADIQACDEYIRQAKIVRSLAYFYAISCFGNTGYVDETSPSGAAPEQMNRADVYAKVVSTLEEVSAEYGDSYATPVYGYVGKECADALLSRFYLNAATFGATPAYDKCWQISQKIIAHHTGAGYEDSGLAESYKALFGANNHEYAAGGSRVNENIWVTPQDNAQLQSYGGSTFYIATVCGSYDGISSVDDCNFNAQWTCMVARQQLSENMNFDADGNPTDLRAELWKTSKDGFEIGNSTIMGNAGYGKGYAPIKYTNFNYDEDGGLSASQPSASQSFANADWTIIRLAEIYLNAAEANILGGAGDANTALDYVNLVRGRAGVEPWTMALMTNDNILAERSRELYGENIRRTDLCRHHKFAGGAYLWNWKGGVHDGAATPETRDLYPIPTKVISFQGYKQNKGYN